MTKKAPQPPSRPRPVRRRSLADLAAIPASGATGGPPQVSPTPVGRGKYPSVTTYLPPRAIKLLKQIALDDSRKLTDIVSEAVDEWLVRKGHPSLAELDDTAAQK